MFQVIVMLFYHCFELTLASITFGIPFRTNILIDPEDAVLGDSVIDEAEKKTTALLFGNSNRVTNEPNVDKACAMLGIGGISAELDDILGDGFGQDDCSSSGMARAPKVPALPSSVSLH